MKIHDLVDEISKVYREECGHIKYLYDEYVKTSKAILEADQANGENITLAEYNHIKAKRDCLKKEIDIHKHTVMVLLVQGKYYFQQWKERKVDMNKFHKWLFKFLTGHELIDYSKLLDTATKILDLAQSVINDNKEIMALTEEVHEESKSLLKKLQEVNGNETLD